MDADADAGVYMDVDGATYRDTMNGPGARTEGIDLERRDKEDCAADLGLGAPGLARF